MFPPARAALGFLAASSTYSDTMAGMGGPNMSNMGPNMSGMSMGNASMAGMGGPNMSNMGPSMSGMSMGYAQPSAYEQPWGTGEPSGILVD